MNIGRVGIEVGTHGVEDGSACRDHVVANLVLLFEGIALGEDGADVCAEVAMSSA